MGKRQFAAGSGVMNEVTLQPWWWRTRYKMAPVYAIGSVIILGLLSKLWASVGQLMMLVAVIVTFLVVLVRARYARGKRKDAGMALFLYILIGTYFGLILAIRFSLLPVGWLLITLAVVFAVFSLFWWFDRKNLRTQQIEEEMRRWPELAKKIGLERVRKGVTKITDTGRKTRLWWNPGEATLDGVQSHARQLESAFNIKHKRIRFEPVIDEDGMVEPNMVDVSENTKSASLKAPVPFDQPTMRTVYDRMFIGPLENNEDYSVVWFEKKWGGKHTLAGGASGSGKSGLYDLFLGESSKCLDMVRFGIDRKGGMTLKPWAPLFDWLVFDDAGTEAMLVGIRAILEARSNYAGNRGWKTWKASPKHPLIVLIIDECAEVLGSNGSGWQNSDLANSIARMGRAAGVLLLLATQHPTTEALSSTQLTKNLGRRFCFSVEDSGGQRAILPNSLELVDATAIPLNEAHAGTFYTSEGGVINTLSGRVRFVTEEKTRELLIDIGDAVSVLDKLSQQAVSQATAKYKENAYDVRQQWLVDDLPPIGEDDSDDDEDDEDDDGTEDVGPSDTDHVAADGMPPTEDEVVVLSKSSDQPPPSEPEEDEGAPEFEYPAEDPGGPEVPLRSLANNPPNHLDYDRAMAAWMVAHREDEITPARANALMDGALDAAGPLGISPKALREIVGRGETTVYEMINERVATGRVERIERGLYRRPLTYQPVIPLDGGGDAA